MILENKVAIVTGAGRGLGRAASKALAEAGAKVAMFGPESGHLRDAAGEISAAGLQCMTVEGDVSVKDDVDRLVDETGKRFGTADILLNNAGIIGPPRFLEDAGPDAWFYTINVNLNGMYLASHAVLPMMIEKGGGRIINVTSGLGRMPFPRFSAYCVSKAGVDQLTRCLSREFEGTGVTVNAIDPGVMDTSMQEQIRGLGEEKLGSDIHGRFVSFKTGKELADPAEVAKLVVYLSSGDSGKINGQILSRADLPSGY